MLHTLLWYHKIRILLPFEWLVVPGCQFNQSFPCWIDSVHFHWQAQFEESLPLIICLHLHRRIPSSIHNLNNYRTISNLPYLSKLVESAVAKQLSEYMTMNNHHEPLQSAYWTAHSTETTIIYILNDLLLALGDNDPIFFHYSIALLLTIW